MIISRCTMLKLSFVAGLAAVAGLSIASPLIAGQAGGARDYKIGLQLYSVRDDCAKDLPGVIKAVGKMGYGGVEFAGYYGRTAEELRKMLDEAGLKCYGTHISLETLLPAQFDKTVAFNKTLGNTMIVVPSIPANLRNSKEALMKTTALFSEIGAKLKSHGMYLGYHNHMEEFKLVEGEMPWYTFFGNASKDVFIQFDTGNAMEGGVQAMPFLAKYPGRVLSVHVKDHSATNPKALLGEGDVKWDEVLPLITGKAGTRWFIIEQETYPFPPLVCAEKNLHTFKKMLASMK